jgi:hypothetical protein
MNMEPEVAHKEVPVEDAARMPVGEPRNRIRDRRNLAWAPSEERETKSGRKASQEATEYGRSPQRDGRN